MFSGWRWQQRGDGGGVMGLSMEVVLWGCRWRWCEGGGGSGGDDEDGVGGVVMKPVRGGDGEARVRVDRIDRKMGSIIGVGRKSPPEKFSGDDSGLIRKTPDELVTGLVKRLRILLPELCAEERSVDFKVSTSQYDMVFPECI
ncbi:hypothetical protein Tco_1469895, partial [Tanacetum coccineum]